MNYSNNSQHQVQYDYVNSNTSNSLSNTIKWLSVAILILIVSNMVGCGYNKLQEQDESMKEEWSHIINEYQSRSDLVPELVAIAKKYADHEQAVFIQVTEARSKINSINITPSSVNNPLEVQKYQAAQDQMDQALSKLIAVSENYPELKSDEVFLSLQDNLVGAERRVAVARHRYIEKVSEYNKTVRKFPTNITAKVFGMDTKDNFNIENEKEISTAPKVNFE